MVSEERKCPTCGRSIPTDANMCPYCGKKFIESPLPVEKNHTGFGTASLVLGIIGIATLWLAIIPIIPLKELFYFFIHIPLGILAVVLGALSYWRKKLHDTYGLAGFIIGLLVLVVGFISLMVAVAISA